MSHKHIYIRHGNDIRTSRKHDERLSDQGKRSVKQKVDQLVEEYGLPDLILYSPFYRCRQTAKIMKKTLTKYHNCEIDKIIDPKLGRYFTRKQKKSPDVKRSTIKKGAIIHEEWKDFKNRVGEHLNHMHKYKDQNVWLITHSLVLIRVGKILEIPFKNWVDYLDTLVVNK